MSFDPPKSHCINCRFRIDLCVCEDAARVAARLSLPLDAVLIMHSKEHRKASNTGHLIRLTLPGSEIRLHGMPHHKVSFDDLLTGSNVALCLFPARGGRILTPALAAEYLAKGQRIRLVVPDGNWGQTTRMLKRLPALASLPRIELASFESSAERLRLRQRRNIRSERVSTYEAIAAAAGALFGSEAQEQLLELYDIAAFRMMALRGKLRLTEARASLGHR